MGSITIVRHTESLFVDGSILIGNIDTPLSVIGIERALSMADEFKNMEFDIVFSSEQIRAIETTVLILSKQLERINLVRMTESDIPPIENCLPFYCYKEINERNYGDLQGQSAVSLIEQYGEQEFALIRRSLHKKPKDGEAFIDVVQRTKKFFDQKLCNLLEQDKNILVVTHQNILRAFFYFMNSVSEDEMSKLNFNPGEYYKIMFYSGTSKLRNIERIQVT